MIPGTDFSRRYWGQNYDHFERVAAWGEEFFWLPKRCYVTKKLLWLVTAYRGVAMYTGPGEAVVEFRFYSKESFMMKALRGELRWDH
jgi:hypothetical protein